MTQKGFPCPLPQLRLNKPRGTYYIAFMAIISFPSLGDRSEAALFCLEMFLHFFGFNFEAGLAVEDASSCFVTLGHIILFQERRFRKTCLSKNIHWCRLSCFSCAAEALHNHLQNSSLKTIVSKSFWKQKRRV